MTKKRLTEQIMDRIIQGVKHVAHGTVTLIVQDSRVIQLELYEKIRLDNQSEQNKSKQACLAEKNPAMTSYGLLRQRIDKAIEGLCYGQVLIAIKGGKVVQIERTEKMRVISQQGMYGDGI